MLIGVHIASSSGGQDWTLNIQLPGIIQPGAPPHPSSSDLCSLHVATFSLPCGLTHCWMFATVMVCGYCSLLVAVVHRLVLPFSMCSAATLFCYCTAGTTVKFLSSWSWENITCLLCVEDRQAGISPVIFYCRCCDWDLCVIWSVDEWLSEPLVINWSMCLHAHHLRFDLNPNGPVAKHVCHVQTAFHVSTQKMFQQYFSVDRLTRVWQNGYTPILINTAVCTGGVTPQLLLALYMHEHDLKHIFTLQVYFLRHKTPVTQDLESPCRWSQ